MTKLALSRYKSHNLCPRPSHTHLNICSMISSSAHKICEQEEPVRLPINTYPTQPTRSQTPRQGRDHHQALSSFVFPSVKRKKSREGCSSPKKKADESTKIWSVHSSALRISIISQVGDSVATLSNSEEDVYYRSDSMKLLGASVVFGLHGRDETMVGGPG